MEQVIANMKFNELCDYIDSCYKYGHINKFFSMAVARRDQIQRNF